MSDQTEDMHRRGLKNGFYSLTVMLAVAALFSGIGCGGGGDSTEPNIAPRIVWMTAQPDTVVPGGTILLSSSAEDPEGDPLSYEWLSPDGIFLQGAHASQVTWQAPAERGRYWIHLMVGDGSNRVVGSIGIWVLSQDPVLAVSPTLLDFGHDDDWQLLEIMNAGRDTLTWTATRDSAWVTVSPTQGVTTDEIVTLTVTVDRSGLASGYRYATLNIDSNVGSATIPVVVWVTAGAALYVDPPILDFGSFLNSLTLTVTNLGVGDMGWRDSLGPDDTTWVSVSPMGGVLGPGASQDVQVDISRAEAPPEGIGALWVKSAGGDVTVALRVDLSGDSSP